MHGSDSRGGEGGVEWKGNGGGTARSVYRSWEDARFVLGREGGDYSSRFEASGWWRQALEA